MAAKVVARTPPGPAGGAGDAPGPKGNEMRRYRNPRNAHPSRSIIAVPSAGGPAEDLVEDGADAPVLLVTREVIEADPEDHDKGLSFDLPRLVGRRKALGVLAAGVGAGVLAACGSSSSDGAASTTTAAAGTSASTSAGSEASTTAATTGTTAGSTDVSEVPEETGGPYPADGTNGPNILEQVGVVRSDITTSIGDYSGTAEGVSTTLTMKLLDVAAGGTPMAGAAVYVWHCTADGGYSMYSQGFEDQNYLRGVQEADTDGNVTFTTVFPACYDGRWPHIHFEVYPSVDDATSASGKLRTSQIALPEKTCNEVYATTGYEASVSNLSRVSLDSDMVFSDGYASQLATVGGSVADGLTLSLNVGV